MKPTNIIDLFHQYKSDTEKEAFLQQVYKNITQLIEKNTQLEDEIRHLKNLLANTTPLLNEKPVEKIVLTPEEALIDAQIEMIRSSNFANEMDLNDVKKLEILLKSKKLLKDEGKTFSGSSKLAPVSNADLLQIAAKKPKSTNDSSDNG